MKKILYIPVFLLAIACIMTISCDKYTDTPDPVIESFSVDSLTAGTRSTLTFTVISDAEHLVFWSGADEHDYYLQDADVSIIGSSPIDEEIDYVPTQTGRVMNDSIVTTSYSEPGVYKAVVVATNVVPFSGELKRITQELEIIISD